MKARPTKINVRLVMLLGVAWAIWASGCDRHESSPANVSGTQQTPGGVIGQRAEQRWDSLIGGDFTAAYLYETPGYRATVSREQYQSQFGGAVQWEDAKVTEVKVADTGDRAEVKVLIQYESAAPAGGSYSGHGTVSERWISSDSDWWHVAD